MKFLDIYNWFKNDGYIILKEWESFDKNLDYKIIIKHFNINDLIMYYASCFAIYSLNYVLYTDLRRDKSYYDICVEHIEQIFNSYLNKTYHIDVMFQNISSCFNVIFYHTILDLYDDYIKMGLMHISN